MKAKDLVHKEANSNENGEQRVKVTSHSNFSFGVHGKIAKIVHFNGANHDMSMTQRNGNQVVIVDSESTIGQSSHQIPKLQQGHHKKVNTGTNGNRNVAIV